MLFLDPLNGLLAEHVLHTFAFLSLFACTCFSWRKIADVKTGSVCYVFYPFYIWVYSEIPICCTQRSPSSAYMPGVVFFRHSGKSYIVKTWGSQDRSLWNSAYNFLSPKMCDLQRHKLGFVSSNRIETILAQNRELQTGVASSFIGFYDK